MTTPETSQPRPMTDVKELAFVHSQVDEYGLTSDEFRVYFRVIRRWNEEKGCFEGARKMAEGIKLCDRVVRNCLYVLVGARLLRRTERGAGRTPRYDPELPARWKNPACLIELRKKANEYRRSEPKNGTGAVRRTAVGEPKTTQKGAVRRTAVEPSGSTGAVRGTTLNGHKSDEKVRYEVPQGEVRGTTGCGTAYRRGVVPGTTEVNPMKCIPISQSPHTHAKAVPSLAGVGSRFSLKQCQKFARYLQVSGQGIRSPGGYGTQIFKTGEGDELIEEFIAKPPRAPWAEYYEKRLKSLLAVIDEEDPRRAVIREVLEQLADLDWEADDKPLRERLFEAEIEL